MLLIPAQIKRVLHDWRDPDAITILRNIAHSMGSNSRLFIRACILFALLFLDHPTSS